MQHPPLISVAAGAASASASRSSTPAQPTPFNVLHHVPAHYELIGSDPEYTFRGPAQIICINDEGQVVFHELVTMKLPQVIGLCPLRGKQSDPWNGHHARARLYSDVLPTLLHCLKDKIVVVGDASKAFKDLRLMAPDANLVQLCYDKVVRDCVRKGKHCRAKSDPQ